jgi:hypothetical protein
MHPRDGVVVVVNVRNGYTKKWPERWGGRKTGGRCYSSHRGVGGVGLAQRQALAVGRKAI